MAEKIYNADQVTLMIGNVLISSGYADGEFISYEQVSDSYVDAVGSDGEVAISRTNDKRVDFSISLLQTSDGNDVLSSFHAAGAFPVPYTIRDRNGRALHEGRCWVRKPPSVTYDRSPTSRQWQMRGVEKTGRYGGNRVA